MVDAVAEQLSGSGAAAAEPVVPLPFDDDSDLDTEALRELFDSLDEDGNGAIDFDELKRGLKRLNVHPRKFFGSRAEGEAD